MHGRDIDKVLAAFAKLHPEVKSWQLKVTHPADDDGIWFFQLGSTRVQAESSTGNCPFVVESFSHPKETVVSDPTQLFAAIEAELGLIPTTR